MSHPKCWSFLVGKPMVVGYHHLRKHPMWLQLRRLFLWGLRLVRSNRTSITDGSLWWADPTSATRLGGPVVSSVRSDMGIYRAPINGLVRNGFSLRWHNSTYRSYFIWCITKCGGSPCRWLEVKAKLHGIYLPDNDHIYLTVCHFWVDFPSPIWWDMVVFWRVATRIMKERSTCWYRRSPDNHQEKMTGHVTHSCCATKYRIVLQEIM